MDFHYSKNMRSPGEYVRKQSYPGVFAIAISISPSFLYLKIKDGGYNNTTINKQLSSTQNTPAVQAYHKYKGNKLEKPDKHGEK